MEHEPKITTPEIVEVTMYFLLADGIGIILGLFGLDDFFILDAIRFPMTQMYLRIRGVKGTYDLVANLFEMIPYVGALPISTVGWFITVYVDRHPKVAQKLAVAKKFIKPTSKKPKGGLKPRVRGAEVGGRARPEIKSSPVGAGIRPRTVKI